MTSFSTIFITIKNIFKEIVYSAFNSQTRRLNFLIMYGFMNFTFMVFSIKYIYIYVIMDIKDLWLSTGITVSLAQKVIKHNIPSLNQC